jgi:tetratricopeptide (TPR) repeat protein
MSSRRKRKNARARKPRFSVFVAALIIAIAIFIVVKSGKTASVDAPKISAPKLSPARAATIEQARRQVAAEGESADAWGQYGMVLRAFDFNNEALKCFRTARSLDPKNPRWPYFISRILRADSPAESLRWLKRTVELTGNKPEAPRYYLARNLAEIGRVDEAETQAKVLLESSTDFTPARLLLAQTAFARGETNAAMTNVTMCLQDPRTTRSAWALLAAIQQRQNDTAGARESSRQAAEATADVPIADQFEAEVAAIRGDPHEVADRVHSLLSARNLAEAGPLIDQIIREQPDFAEGWLLRGRFLLIQKQLPAAEEALQRHLKLDPKSTQGYFQLGAAYLNGGKFADAQQAFRKAIELKEDFGPAWFNLAYALGRQGKWAEAAPLFEQAIRYNPEHIESYLLFADVQLQLKNPDEAEKLLAAAARINASDPRIAPLRQKLARKK